MGTSALFNNNPGPLSGTPQVAATPAVSSAPAGEDADVIDHDLLRGSDAGDDDGDKSIFGPIDGVAIEVAIDTGFHQQNQLLLTLLAKFDDQSSAISSLCSEQRTLVTIVTCRQSTVNSLRAEITALRNPGPPSIAKPPAPASYSSIAAQGASAAAPAQTPSKRPSSKAKAPKPAPVAKPAHSRKERTITLLTTRDRPNVSDDAILTAVNAAIGPHRLVLCFRSYKDNVCCLTPAYTAASEVLALSTPISNAVRTLGITFAPPCTSSKWTKAIRNGIPISDSTHAEVNDHFAALGLPLAQKARWLSSDEVRKGRFNSATVICFPGSIQLNNLGFSTIQLFNCDYKMREFITVTQTT